MKNFIKKLLNEYINAYGSNNHTNNIIESTQEKEVVGVLIKSEKTSRVLVLLRNDEKPKWALMSGTMEKGEDQINAIKREIKEELQISDDIINSIKFKFVRTEYVKIPQKENSKGEIIPETTRVFHYYQGFVKNEFEPQIQNDPDKENIVYEWVSLEDVNTLQPIYQGLKAKIEAMLKVKTNNIRTNY
jgi:8-oxo-dGTP pyrophosphatase MutT (NUDIX family)